MNMDSNPHSDLEAATRVYSHATVAWAIAQGMSTCHAEIKGIDLHGVLPLHIQDVFCRMAPRDPIEEMLVGQMLVAHSKSIRLSGLSQRAATPEMLQVTSEYAEKASNTYRRLALALAEYRRPPRGPDSFTSIQQANIAQQQVIQHHEKREIENTTNEQGLLDSAGFAAPALPTECGGAAGLGSLGPARTALETGQGPADAGR